MINQENISSDATNPENHLKQSRFNLLRGISRLALYVTTNEEMAVGISTALLVSGSAIAGVGGVELIVDAALKGISVFQDPIVIVPPLIEISAGGAAVFGRKIITHSTENHRQAQLQRNSQANS